MGQCSTLFHNRVADEESLNKRITPTEEQMTLQQERWNDLRDFLVDRLSDETGLSMRSWLQGSYKFRTQVRPLFMGEEFDIDLGLYFKWSGLASAGDYGPDDLKAACQTSLEVYGKETDHDVVSVEPPKKNCNRIRFNGDFHIDVPVYHLDEPNDDRTLASEDGWVKSDPKAIYIWFRDKFLDDDRAVVRRLIRYMKAWSILRYHGETGRPSSVLLTVLVADACISSRINSKWEDDDALQACIEVIIARLEANSRVLNPVDSSEDLSRLSDDQMGVLIQRLRDFQTVAQRANAAETSLAGAFLWQEAFGHFFPLPEDEVLVKSDRSLPVLYPQPEILVDISLPNGNRSTSINTVGPVPKKTKLKFTLMNLDRFPREAIFQWIVRNSGEEASRTNDLGHTSQAGPYAEENTAYNGRHFMDCMVVLHGNLISIRRVPVIVNNAQYMRRTRGGRPAWTSLR
nr:hypothetical protein [Ruegeria arenilitoris]